MSHDPAARDAPDPAPVSGAGEDPVTARDTHVEHADEPADEQGGERAAAPTGGPLPVTPPEIAGYELHEVIGRGSAGVVYRATQLAVEREVAIKVLHPELAGKPRVVRRMQREARTMARLRHPNVVSAIDMGQSQGRWWFAMEYVDGPSLLDRLRVDGRLTEREALRLFTAIAEALEHLGAHGVVHRDVKPANILITSAVRDAGRGRAVLADLGLAFAESDASLTRQGGGTLGTPHYISPEQARDASEVDLRADIWGFGATLFHALCGRPPFRSDSVAEVLSAVLHGRVPDPRHFAPELSSGMVLVLRKCLTRDPDGRYQTPRELLDDLDRLRERRGPRVRKRELDPLDGEGLRLPGWALGAGLGLLLGLGVAGLAWWNMDPAPALAGDGLAGELPFPPLQELLSDVREDPSRLGGALAALDELQPLVPEGPQWWAATLELNDLLRARLSETLGEVGRAVDAALAAEDLAGAQRLADGGLAQRLLDAADVDLRALSGASAELAQTGQERLLARVAGARESAVAQAARSLRDRFEALELPALRGEIEQRRYASALARLDGLVERALGHLDVAAPRWLADDIAAAGAELAGDLARLRSELRDGWTSAQRSLQDWLEAELPRSVAQLGWTTRLATATSEFERRLAEEFERRGLLREELTVTGARLLGENLARRTDELATAFEARVPAAVEAAFELRRTLLLGELYRGRRAARAARLLDDFGRAASPGGLALRPQVAAEFAVLREEARRLTALHGFALAGVERADREGLELELAPLPGVRVPGRIAAGADPAADGFRLKGRDGLTHALRIETLATRDYEQLIALGAGASEVAPLDLALLRLREGDALGAGAALAREPSRAGAGEPSAAAVVELRRRVRNAAIAGSSGGLEPPAERRALALFEALGDGAERPLLEDTDAQAAVVALELLLGELGAARLEVSFAREALDRRLAALR